jgi:hypothetical protein
MRPRGGQKEIKGGQDRGERIKIKPIAEVNIF